jgi:glutathione S-transferase
MALTFYHGHGSPYSWRVWLALEHLGIPYELKVLSFSEGDTQKPEFVAINPRHQVPTIVDDGFALWESAAIVEFLDERFPAADPARRLFPGDVRNRAVIRRFVREFDEYMFNDGLGIVTEEHFFSGDRGPDAARVAKAKDALARELFYAEERVAGPFLCGASPTAADFALYPNLAYVTRLTARKPELALTQLVGPKVAAWQRRIEALPYYDKTYPPHWRS